MSNDCKEPTEEEKKATIEKALSGGSWLQRYGDEKQHWAGRIVGYQIATVVADPPVIILTLHSAGQDEGVLERRDLLLTPSDASLLAADLQYEIRTSLDIEGHQVQ